MELTSMFVQNCINIRFSFVLPKSTFLTWENEPKVEFFGTLTTLDFVYSVQMGQNGPEFQITDLFDWSSVGIWGNDHELKYLNEILMIAWR